MVTRDGFLSKYNLSIPTGDFIEILKSFPTYWKVSERELPFIFGVKGNWSERYVAK